MLNRIYKILFFILLIINSFVSGWAKEVDFTVRAVVDDSISMFRKNALCSKKEACVLKVPNLVHTSHANFISNNKPLDILLGNKPSVSVLRINNEKIISNMQILPNSVNDEFTIQYELNKQQLVSIKLMDLLGNEVSTLMAKKLINEGYTEMTFNVNNTNIEKGYYFVRVIVGEESFTKRINVF